MRRLFMPWEDVEGCVGCGCPPVVRPCSLCSYTGDILVTISNRTHCPCADGYSVRLRNQQPGGWWGDVLPPPFCGYDPVEIFKPALTCFPAPGSSFCVEDGVDTWRFEGLWLKPSVGLLNISFEIPLFPTPLLTAGCSPCQPLSDVPSWSCAPFFIQVRGVPVCLGQCGIGCDPPPPGEPCSDGSGVSGTVDITITEVP